MYVKIEADGGRKNDPVSVFFGPEFGYRGSNPGGDETDTIASENPDRWDYA